MEGSGSSGGAAVEKGPTTKPPVSKPETRSAIGSLEDTIASLREKVAKQAQDDVVGRDVLSKEPREHDLEGITHEPTNKSLFGEVRQGDGYGGVVDTGKVEAKGGLAIEPKKEEAIDTEASAENAPKIPGKVANDPEFKRTWGDMYSNAKQQGDVDIAMIDQQALSEYYNNWAKDQGEKSLPEEIKNDPLYKQKLGEEVIEAASKNEPLDSSKLTEKALAEYQRVKDLKKEKLDVANNQAGEEQAKIDQETEQKIADLTNEVAKLSQENAEIKKLMESVLKHMQETDPEKKKSLLRTLLEHAAAIGLNIATEGGREIVNTRQ